MDAPALSGTQPSPVKDFDQIVEIRAAKREHLRGRNNVTLCRSPSRELDIRLIKNGQKEKRHQEFLKRRSVSPEPCASKSTNRSAKTFSMKYYSSSSKSKTLHTNRQNSLPANEQPVIILTPHSSVTDNPSTTNKWASLWSEQISLMRQDKGHARKQASTATPVIMESNQHRTTTIHKRDSSFNVQKTNIKTFIQTEKIHQRSSMKTENIPQKKILRETSVQTELGLVTVKESDVQRLADYLQEALWREEAVKKKLAALQQSTTNLLNSSNKIWTSHCSEDLLRNQIKALEAQLQVCVQKFPKDGMKKVVLQMEKQRMVYEEKAVVALQKATQQKTEALSKADTLQEALTTAKMEALRWQSLYEELKRNSEQLREKQHLSNEQLQQLQNQVELSRAREDELREEVMSLKQEKQYNICLLEEENQTLREEIQHLTDGCNESQDVMMQECFTSEEAEPQLTVRKDTLMEEQLRHTQEKLQLKERECEELQMELHVIEQECQSSQARLSQCRDELRQLSHRRRKPTQFVSWWRVCVFFLLLLAVAGVAMLWLWHPPFREQVEDLYSDIETRIEDYLMEMRSPQHSGCCEKRDLTKLSFTYRTILVCTMRTAELLFVLGLCVLSVTSSLKICAFNVQSFGESKANNKKVMGILRKILSRCDLCLIQEVRDTKGEVIPTLVEDLNSRFDKSNSYSYVESERLGRNTYKEQYVYIFRNNVLKVKEHYQCPKLEGAGANKTDVFSREPFIIRFISPTTLVKDFVLIGQHTCPKNAMKEIDELYTVFKGIYKKWKTDNVMILGDLNAGCSYVTVKGWRAVRLRSDPKFRWLIGDEQDTTVREKTHCAYDRIIVHGREIISGIVPGSAQPFNFKENFHLTEAQALEVSDHFPVEVDLKPNHRYLLRNEL
ncbi:TRAF3-interacting JNK-activating modulator-like [Embiotoca jacksoni]|uniref:TRAF3-interacting JNK-activating modulator-like n=1 Tax=Embiotoca jacksoni TaxID=100190 RepID=UPI0037047375